MRLVDEHIFHNFVLGATLFLASVGLAVGQPITTALSITSSANPSSCNNAVTFAVTLPAMATGSVNFLDNGLLFDTEIVSNGTATSAAIFVLPVGSNSITAQYAGDANYLGSTNTLNQSVVILPVWWNNFPRIINAGSVGTAQAFAANADMNGVANDPGWGLWFTYGSDNGTASSNLCASYSAAGIASLSYNEGFGQTATVIVELQWNAALQRYTLLNDFWDWQNYAGGPVAWAGFLDWFDSFSNVSYTTRDEPSYFARPYTRMNPTYGGAPMLYPNGTIATGFLNNDTNATDPRNSRVYDAGAAKDIYGNLRLDPNYNSVASATNQEVWISGAGQYSGLLWISKDAACPCWTNIVSAFTLASVELTGLPGSWSDNFSSWDSFMCNGPVASAFGDWSVARFQNYLTNQFTAGQLAGWGVLATNNPLTTITNFDVRAYFLNVASNQFGLGSPSLTDSAWDNRGWLNQPIWCAFKIFRRQNGSAALTGYDQAVHGAATQGGQTNFALLANDITPAMFGWARGTFDLTSTELSLCQQGTGGPNGFGLPPYARLSPLYKYARELGRSRFVTVWLYNDGYTSQLTNAGPVNALYYEMLATHTLPQIVVGDARYPGTPTLQQNFMNFVAQNAAPAFANRVPIEEVGLYVSTSSILTRALPGDAFDYADQYHQYAVWGWGTALSQLHYQYRMVPEWRLNRSLLQTLKVLIVPNAEAFEPGDVDTLQTWVASGGCLIVTGDSGSRLGESGNFALTNNLVLAPLTGVVNFNIAPAAQTNLLGAGVVYYFSNNLGSVYYNESTTSRAAQLPYMATVVANAFAILDARPVLASSNAPATVGLTLYQDPIAQRTFVDLNNFNVDTHSYVTYPTPVVEVDLPLPAWLTNGLTAAATVISPDGPLSVISLNTDSNRVYLQLPSVTNYLSVILQPKTPPRFDGWAASGNNWVFSGSNGVANWTYYLLASTNLGLPPGPWTIISTNQFDAKGRFNLTNPAAPSAPHTFFRLQLK